MGGVSDGVRRIGGAREGGAPERFWRGTGGAPERFWRGTGGSPERFCHELVTSVTGP